jgi:hypothetical protein
MPDEPQPPPAPPGQPAPPGWSLAHRLFFRLVFCYFLLYTLPQWDIGLLPKAAVIWVATHVFDVSGHAATYFMTGSGDTTLAYVENLCFVVLALLGAVVWSLLDRKRKDYATLHAWFRIWMRFTLALILFEYGFAKVLPLQMQVYLPNMVERWGDFSPMGAVWNFIAASKPYEIFAGVSEVLPGLLLLFRRTTCLGAIISLAVMCNVSALNYCYDVPVKLFSTNLILMSFFLIGPDLPRLTRLFFLNRPALPADLNRPALPRRWMRIVARLVWVFATCAILYQMAHGNWTYYASVYLHPDHPPVYGFYEVESFSRNGQETPPLLTDTARWRWLYVQSAESVAVTLMNDKRQYYQAKQEAAKNTLTLSGGQEHSVFTYSWSDTNHLVLRGSMSGDDLEVRLRKVAQSDFPLFNRGFHWINEYPINH